MSSSDQPQRALVLHSTGSPALDQILGGGLPGRSVTLVVGEPGSGKTVFSLQVLFHFARQGKKALHFTTLSEPSLKLLRFMQEFAFFDAELVDRAIQFVDIGTTLRGEHPERTLAEITDRVEREEPDIVVIDSFKAISEILGDAARARTFVYDLAVQMAGWGALTLLIGEYTAEEMGSRPEFAVADGILRLSTRRSELTATRQLDVLKLRGAGFVGGQHFLDISAAGVTFYARVRSPEGEDPRIPLSERVSSGVAGLDELLGGGFPRGSATVVHGGTGTGKTLLGLSFLVEGARRGEPGVLFSLEETPNQTREIARGFGWDLAALEAQGLFSLIYTSPVELSTDRFLDRARRHVEERGARRAVLDSLTSMSLGAPSERRFKELVYALTKHLRRLEVSVLLTMETVELLGSTQLSGHGVSFAADNVVQLRYVEAEGRLERGISVLKARGVAHGTELRRMAIGPRGVEIGARYPSAHGVLTGGRAP